VNPIGVRSCYDEGKRCAETLFFDYCATQKYVINSPHFNTYGLECIRETGALSQFYCPGLLDMTLHLRGWISDPFLCYVNDLVDGLVRLMASPDALVEPVNIGNPVEISMLDLASDGFGTDRSRQE